MESVGEEAAKQGDGCRLLWAMAGVDAEQMLWDGAIAPICMAMRAGVRDSDAELTLVALHALRAMARLSFSSKEEGYEMLFVFGAAQVVREGIEAFPASADFQEEACGIMEELAGSPSGDEVAAYLGGQRVYEAFAVAEPHHHGTALQSRLADCARVLLIAATGMHLMHEARAVLALLEAHERDEATVRHGLHHCAELVRSTLDAGHLLHDVVPMVEAMEKLLLLHLACVHIVIEGLGVLRQMAQGPYQVLLNECGTTALIVTAMCVHHREEEVQRSGIEALLQLSGTPTQTHPRKCVRYPAPMAGNTYTWEHRPDLSRVTSLEACVAASMKGVTAWAAVRAAIEDAAPESDLRERGELLLTQLACGEEMEQPQQAEGRLPAWLPPPSYGCKRKRDTDWIAELLREGETEPNCWMVLQRHAEARNARRHDGEIEETFDSPLSTWTSSDGLELLDIEDRVSDSGHDALVRQMATSLEDQRANSTSLSHHIRHESECSHSDLDSLDMQGWDSGVADVLRPISGGDDLQAAARTLCQAPSTYDMLGCEIDAAVIQDSDYDCSHDSDYVAKQPTLHELGSISYVNEGDMQVIDF